MKAACSGCPASASPASSSAAGQPSVLSTSRGRSPPRPRVRGLAAADALLPDSRRVVHQPIHDLEDLGLPDEMQVVEEQDDALSKAREVIRQLLQQRLR